MSSLQLSLIFGYCVVGMVLTSLIGGYIYTRFFMRDPEDNGFPPSGPTQLM